MTEDSNFFKPVAVLVPIGLILNAVWHTIVGVQLYKLESLDSYQLKKG